MRSSLLLAPLGLTLALAACKDDPALTSAKPDCDAIVERCHPLDPGSGPIHECHETAESRETSNAMCAAQRAACFAVCVATDGGADASTDAAPDAGHRDPVCALLGSRCHAYDDHDGGVGHQCLELGHTNDPVTCAARQVECLAACPESDGGAADATVHD
jgi:hypothetical protein